MTKYFLTASVLAFIVATSSAGFAASLEQGKKDFTTYCAPCHGVSGRGDGPVAPELMKKPIDLTAFTRKEGGVFPADKVKKLVDGRTMPRAHGTPQMPIWGQWFSYQATAGGLLQEDRKAIKKQVNERLDSLVIYIKSIQK
ncbi:MAG TPA: c-type cytochrome [Rhizobiales bacterium]|nr:c-type cytochrome [Hyphomicrobiales bacterium]